MLKTVQNKFKELFNDLDSTRNFFSPGRVNIIGEHIDYNGGYVMPCAIDRGTYFVIRLNNTNTVRTYSMQFEDLGVVEFDIYDETHNKNYTDFVKGIIKIFDLHVGFDMVCCGTIPHSSGLSSSASFCTGLGFALSSLLNKPVAGTALALACKRVENEFMGVNSGIMDQFIIANGVDNGALLLDCNTLKYEVIPFDLEDNVLVIANTNKKRLLADSKYNERRAECDAVLEILKQNGYNYSVLCEIDDAKMNELMPLIKDEKLQRRFRHVVSENVRTIKASEALKNHDIKTLGKLLTESHMSLEKDYEVTGKELDTLVHNFLAQEGCIGARMTGAGFGGCSIALFKKGYEQKAIENVKAIYTKEIGYEPSFYEVEVSGGTREI